MSPIEAAGPEIERVVRAALDEDVGAGDWTTLWTVPERARASARILAKADGVLAGTDAARIAFRELDPRIQGDVVRGDGARVASGDVVLRLRGSARAILTAERTALNFLQRLSGIATLTRRYVDAVAGTSAAILDTRKTTPGLRALEKRAVVAGGGANHRSGLFDMVLLKENHLAMAGGVEAALEAITRANRDGLDIEVEVRTLAEVDRAIAAGAQRLLLDNMSVEEMREAVRRARQSPRVRLEASGNMSLDRVRAVAETGVDFISVGALTHSAPALDLSLLLEPDA